MPEQADAAGASSPRSPTPPWRRAKQPVAWELEEEEEKDEEVTYLQRPYATAPLRRGFVPKGPKWLSGTCICCRTVPCACHYADWEDKDWPPGCTALLVWVLPRAWALEASTQHLNI